MVYWFRERQYGFEDDFDSVQRRSRRNHNVRFERQRRGNFYRTDYGDRYSDDFVVIITRFPWGTDEELSIKEIINSLCDEQFVYPKSIKIITDRETGKPRYGYISFNSEFELNEILQTGVLKCCNCKRIMTKETVPQRNKDTGNLIYIKNLQEKIQISHEIIDYSSEEEERLRNMLMQSRSQWYCNFLEDALERGRIVVEMAAEEYNAIEDFESREKEMKEKITLLEAEKSELEKLKDDFKRKNEQLLQQNSELRDENERLENEVDRINENTFYDESSEFVLDSFNKLEDRIDALERHNEGLKARLKETDSYIVDLEDLNKQLHDRIESLNHVFKLPDENNFQTNFVINHSYLQPLDQIVVSSNDAVRQRLKIGNTTFIFRKLSI